MADARCEGCGSTFPRGYWHECPGDQLVEKIASEIASWVLRACLGKSAREIADGISAGAWRKQ